MLNRIDVENDPVNFIDPWGLKTAVIIGRPTSGNPFGHVAIAFSGQGVYSYGTKTERGSSLTAYLSKQASYRDSTVYILDTTPEQEAKMKGKIMEYDKIDLPDAYHDPFGARRDSCATRTLSSLEAGGITSDNIPLNSPFPVNTEVLSMQNSNVHMDIPKGGEVPTSLSGFNK